MHDIEDCDNGPMTMRTLTTIIVTIVVVVVIVVAIFYDNTAVAGTSAYQRGRRTIQPAYIQMQLFVYKA